MLNSQQLHQLAEQHNLPARQLSEAQEVLLYYHLPESELYSMMAMICQSTSEQGGGIAMFDKLLKGQISILRSL